MLALTWDIHHIKYEYSGWGWKYSNIIIGARGNFHYPLMNKLDTYTGLLLGYNVSSFKRVWNRAGLIIKLIIRWCCLVMVCWRQVLFF